MACIVLALAGAADASAGVRSYHSYASHGRVFKFKIGHLKGAQPRYATISVHAVRQRWRVSKRRLQVAVRRGRLRAYAPRSVHAALARRIRSAGRRTTKAKLTIHVRKRHSGAPVSQPPAPTQTQDPAGSGSGSGSTTGGGGGSTSTPPAGDNFAAPCGDGVGSFGVGRWPSACWRPYSDSSPFNRALSSNPRVAANSDQVVQRLLGFGKIQNLLAGRAGTRDDYGHPTFWSQPTDPWFTIHCSQNWGRCALEGVRIQIPDAAKPAGGSDGHMTVVDQRTGWEYDMWQVASKPAGGGTLVTGWGGKTRIDGDGLGSDGVAAQFGNLAGKLREEELQSGQINHALFIFVNCDSGQYVYPATKTGRPCSAVGASNSNAPAMGQRFQLDMSDSQIDALAVPDWKKTILRAMAHYGMYVGDTGGSWGIKEEGGTTYTSFGYRDKWVDYAKSVGAPYYSPDSDWIFNLSDGVDWQRYLRVIDPCEADGTCS